MIIAYTVQILNYGLHLNGSKALKLHNISDIVVYGLGPYKTYKLLRLDEHEIVQ